MALTSSFLP